MRDRSRLRLHIAARCVRITPSVEGAQVTVGALAVSAAMLIVVAGAAKFRTPGPAAAMIVSWWPGSRPLRRARMLARCAGIVELGAGVAIIAFGGRLASAALAGCYLVLAAVALRLATGSQRASCGCFGAADGVVGVAHVVLDLACLGVACWAFVQPPAGVVALFDPGAEVGVGVLAQALLLAALGYLSITALPALSAARRTVEGTS